MLDKARPELITSDLLRETAYEPNYARTKGLFGQDLSTAGTRPAPPVPRLRRSWLIPLMSLALIELLAALAPENANAPPVPLLVDGLGWVFVIGMMLMPFSLLLPRTWSGRGAAVLGTVGLGLHAWCGLAGHVPMTAGWYMVSGLALGAYAAVGAGVATRP